MGAKGPIDLKEIISADPAVLNGKTVFKGTDVPVESLFEHLESGAGLDAFLKEHPMVPREQAVSALEGCKEWIVSSGKRKSLLGCMAGTIEILGDIVAPIDEEWDAMK